MLSDSCHESVFRLGNNLEVVIAERKTSGINEITFIPVHPAIFSDFFEYRIEVEAVRNLSFSEGVITIEIKAFAIQSVIEALDNKFNKSSSLDTQWVLAEKLTANNF